MKQFFSFVRKEFYHILRDRRTMLILLVMPVLLIILFGYAITTEVKNSRVAVVDFSHDEYTRDIQQAIEANRYFQITKTLNRTADIDPLFRSGDIDLALIFCENFAEEAVRTGNATLQILSDGSEPNQAAIRVGYLQQILLSVNLRHRAQSAKLLSENDLSAPPSPTFVIDTSVRMLYNPQSKSEYNFVPGVIGLILMLICAMMTSIAIVREKEQGTMEVLLASPLPPVCIVLAKLVPYFVISCLNLATILLLSRYLLGIPIAGSVIGLIGVSLLYIVVGLLLGLFISTVVDSQLAAMLLSLLLLIPSLYLSGMAFPIESMPDTLQRVSCIIPTRWYIDAARKLMIQGVPMRFVVKEVLILLLMASVLFGVAWRMFRIRL